MLGMCRFADDAAGEDDDGDDDGGGGSGGDCGDDGDAEGGGVSYDLSDPFIDDSLGLPAAEPCAGYGNDPVTAEPVGRRFRVPAAAVCPSDSQSQRLLDRLVHRWVT
eukprot:COSAG01_NODE_7948_length_2979_cov_16.479167_4_plen_107_part_00